MTTPAPGVTVSADKTTYNVGDPITVTVEYPDAGSAGTTLTVTAVVTNSDGTTATGTAEVQVGAVAAVALPVSVTDSESNVYTQQSNEPGTAIFTGVLNLLAPGA